MFNKEIARQNDERIEKLARYVENGGITHCIRNKEAIFARFSELKLLVKRGEFSSVDELEESIYKRYGIVDNDLDSDIISDIIEKADRDLAAMERYEKSKENGNKVDGDTKVHS